MLNIKQLPYDNAPFIRFTGKFRDLIPNGWVFEKFGDKNYRCYTKKVNPINPIRVWQACGGYVEFADFLEHSYLFMQFLLDEANVEKIRSGFETERPGGGYKPSFEFFINMSGQYIVLPDDVKQKPNYHLQSSSLADPELLELEIAYYEEWRSVTVKKELFYACLDMIRSGMVEIVIP